MAAFLVRGTAANSRRITLNAGILSKPGNLNAGAELPHLNRHCTQRGDPGDGTVKDPSPRDLANQEERFEDTEDKGPSPYSILLPCQEANLFVYY